MNRKCLFVACVGAFLSLSALAGSTSEYPVDTASAAALRSDMSLILVTFQDQPPDRPSITSPAANYRQRGSNYGSTWRETITAKLAERYHLKAAQQWPITALGLHCVVFQLTNGQDLKAVTEQLRKDELVDSVQPMQKFFATTVP